MKSSPAVTSVPRGLIYLLAYAGFISLGLPDTLIGVAWPDVRTDFGLSQSGLGLISIALGSGYVLSSFLSGALTQRLGIGWLLSLSSLLVVLAMFGKASVPLWIIFLASSLVLGLGSGAIDAGINAYAARHFSAGHLNWLHASYSLGATAGPLVMTAALVEAHSWQVGYAGVGVTILILAIGFLFTHRLWDDSKPGEGAGQPPVTISSALAKPVVWLQIALFFTYTGLELMVGNWCYTLLTEAREVPPQTAGLLASAYFASIGGGRVLMGALVSWIGVDRLTRAATLVAILGAALFAFGTPLPVSIAGLLLLGLGLAPLFPCWMARTPERVGASYAAHAVGFQVSAATIGSATISALTGLMAENSTLEVVAQFALVLAVLLWLQHEVLLRWPPQTAPTVS